jgi:5'-nucleotidase / UDP-sugar diphosphatase
MIGARTFKAAGAALLVAGLLSGCLSSDPPPEAAFTLQLLHFADADGSDTTALNSIANFSGLVEKFRSAMPEQTLLVSSGDNYIPGPRFNAADNQAALRTLLGREGVGRADIAFLNALGVQASVIGNHELDLGTGTFRDLIAPQVSGSSVVWEGAQFPYLAYNTDFSADANTRNIEGQNGLFNTDLKGKVAGWAKVQVGKEVIGVIGAGSPTFKNITSVGDLDFRPALINGAVDIDGLAAEIQAGVDEMTRAGINKVVLLAHMQTIATEKALATRLQGVDIIVAGGSNTLLADSNDALRSGDRAADTYPLRYNSKSGEPVVVVNVDADYKYLGRFIAPFDDKGVLIPERFDSEKSGAWATSDSNDAAGGVTPLARIVAIRDAIKGVINAKDGVFYGFTSVFLEGRRSAVRTEETNLGNLSADANLAYAQALDSRVQISLKNGGGIRAEIGTLKATPGTNLDPELLPPAGNPEAGRPDGAVSLLMLETTFKFDNKLWVFDVTASRLHALLEHGVGAVENVGGRFPQVAGVAFSFDPNVTPGVVASDGSSTTTGRIRTVRVGNDQVVLNGQVQGDPNRPFRLVTLNFLATGGDGYRFGSTNAAGDGLPNLIKLETAPASTTALGGAVDLPAGGEQDAMAEFLKARHPDAASAYSEADTPVQGDGRIQNLKFRSDGLIP